jgi:SAM-dependent methyltransferase
LAVDSNSIDVVMNVESCHGYGDVKIFLSEVLRVLKPGGHLLLVDFRNSVENMDLFKQELKDSGLTLLSAENISANVVAAIESDDGSKRAKIESLVPRRYQKLFCDFAGVVGSRFYTTLKDGTRPYYRFVLTKPS